MKKQSGLDAATETPAGGTGTAAGTASVGADFKRTRMRQSITLDTIARDLNIGKEFLAAIENDDTENLPEPAYAIGFVRSYARYLDLDAAEMIVRFKAETLSQIDVDEMLMPTPLRESRFPTGLLAIISVVVAGLAYGSWELYTQQAEDQRGGATVAAAPDETGKPGATTVAKATPIPAAKKPAAAPANAATNASSKTKQTTVAEKKSVAPTAVVTARKKPTAGNTANTRADKKIGDVAAKVHAGSGEQRVVLRAMSSTWIRIRDAGNTILFTRVLREGDQYVVPKKDGIVVDIGNAGGLQIVLNGKVLKPVGPANMPVYNISLSPDALKKREEAANTGGNN